MMQTLEIYGRRIWSLLKSKSCEVKRQEKEPGKAKYLLQENHGQKVRQGYTEEMWVAWSMVGSTKLEMSNGH